MSKSLSVLMVDDHALFREGLASVIDRADDIEVVGQASNGQEALKKARELMPDLILMDIKMPVLDGLGATVRIKEEMPYVKIIILTVSDDDRDLFEAIKSGAEGYITKEVSGQELLDMLRGVHRGEAAITRLTAARILDEFARLAQDETWRLTGNSICLLSPREQQVLKLVAQGVTNKEIASCLFIAENTVKNQLCNILSKLHLENRVQAATYALRHGLVGGSVPDT